MGRVTWHAAVDAVTKSQAWLSDWTDLREHLLQWQWKSWREGRAWVKSAFPVSTLFYALNVWSPQKIFHSVDAEFLLIKSFSQ